MLVSAEWVLPVDAPPIRDGAVLLVNGRVSRVGPGEVFADVSERVPRVDFPGCAVVPGLVNAHTHLSLSALEGLLPSADFADWLAAIVPLMRMLSVDELADSVVFGALRSLNGGVTVVGDIAYGPEAPAAAADMGLGGVFCWEVLGVPAAELRHRLHATEFPLHEGAGRHERVRIGISPHSAYSSGPELLRAVARLAAGSCLLAVHVAESQAETELVKHGTGPLAEVAARIADGFTPPRTSPVRYLADLGVLDGALAVHCVHLAPGDVRILAEHARGVALCPLSNRYLRNGMPPVAALARSGLPVGVGTDSLASNTALDLFAEARALGEADAALTPARLLEIMTLEGARALGVDDAFGSLTPGKQGDLVAVRIGTTRDPAAAVVAARPADIEAVATAGTWRVREGRPTQPVARIEASVERIADNLRRLAHRPSEGEGDR